MDRKTFFLAACLAVTIGAFFYLRRQAEVLKPQAPAEQKAEEPKPPAQEPEPPVQPQEARKEEPVEKIIKAPNRWDGPLLVPVESTGEMMVMIPYLCSRGATPEEEKQWEGRNVPLEWSPKISNRAHGMTQGSPVKAITRAGLVKDAAADKLWCLKGECGEHYAAITLKAAEHPKVAVVVDAGFLSRGTGVSSLVRAFEVSDLPVRYPVSKKDGKEIKGGYKDFTSWALEGDEKLALQTFVHPGDSAVKKLIPMVDTYARVLKRAKREWYNPGADAWLYLGRHIDPPEAVLALIEKGKPARILWRTNYPVGGQALMMTRVNPDGSLTKGREFRVGQQKCD